MTEHEEQYLRLVYGHGHLGPQPHKAAEWLAREPALATVPPWDMPPLIAVTHSSLQRLDPAGFARRVSELLAAGADPNVRWRSLSALYGACEHRQPAIAQLLLAAGADPNDGESMYHAVPDEACIRLLLEAGARVTGSNALARSLDFNALGCTRLLLAHGDLTPAELAHGLMWAIRRGRSARHIDALLDAGADPAAELHGISAYRAALFHGLTEAAARLREMTGAGAPEGFDAFLAACGRADAEAARAARTEVPAEYERLLPDQVEAGNLAAARLMVEMGWRIDARGGDWQASALNLAVFRGDARLARFLLERGASWREQHGFGDNVRGTLTYASRERPIAGGDWAACARVLEEFGMPPLETPVEP